MVDTRMTVRYAIDLPARLRVGETEMHCRIRDISLGGLLVIGPALPPGTKCTVYFRAPGVEGFSSRCVARWAGGDRSGLAFEGLQPMDTYQLARFTRQVARMTLRMPALLHGQRPPARRC